MSAGDAGDSKPGAAPTLGQTPSQTVGPFFAYGLVAAQYGYPFRSLFGAELAEARADGEPIVITGQVFDGEGNVVEDAMVEILHADAHGAYPRSPDDVARTGFRGFGRMGTGSDARKAFEFRTVKPGAGNQGHAPYVAVVLTMRGLLNHLFTRLYFDDEGEANARDPVLSSVPAERRSTLLAKGGHRSGGIRIYRFDIHLQGERETVFFDA
jgi:protocatechuate 3,4-dioxygenase, alpha subunit